MQRPAFASALLTMLAACASRGPTATSVLVPPATTSSSPSAAPAPPRCEVAGDDVWFDELDLHSEEPAEHALVVHPFAELHRATHVELQLAKKASSIALETTIVHLRGVVESERLRLHPATASTFSDVVIPLAMNMLDVRSISGNEVELLPARPGGVFFSIEPERRPCSFLRIRPEKTFDLDTSLGLHPKSRVRLPPGGYSLRTSPEARSSKVTLYLTAGDELGVLEDRDDWLRIIFTTDDTAFVGWLERENAGWSLGRGYGTKSGRPPKNCAVPRTMCEDELPLFAEIGGKRVAIGTTKRGAPLAVDAPRGDIVRAHLCDPDVTFLEPVMVPAHRATACLRPR